MKRKHCISVLLFIAASSAFAGGLPSTDVGGVYDTGSQADEGVPKISIASGLYEIGLEDHWRSEQFLLVDVDINNPSRTMAILFPKKPSRKNSTARLYQGRPIKNGTGIMFSPLFVDASGNIRVQSEVQTDAPVIEVLPRMGDYRYPYILRGRNGALGGQLYGMRGSSRSKPQLRAFPKTGIFASVKGPHADVMVSGSELSIFNGAASDQTYDLVSLNGSSQRFAALTRSKLDSMGEVELGDEQVKKIATFITGCFDRELLLLMQPAVEWGEYRLEVFEMSEPSVVEEVFPGYVTQN